MLCAWVHSDIRVEAVARGPSLYQIVGRHSHFITITPVQAGRYLATRLLHALLPCVIYGLYASTGCPKSIATLDSLLSSNYSSELPRTTVIGTYGQAVSWGLLVTQVQDLKNKMSWKMYSTFVGWPYKPAMNWIS